jgi:alpha-mannosidase
VSDDKGGLTVANLGLNEYEVLRDGRNTIAATLLRSVSELGDWGVFPTPEAQCLGEHTAEMEIIPHRGDGAVSGSYAEAYQFQIPWTVCQTGIHEGKLEPDYVPLTWVGEGIAFSSMKIGEASCDLMLRWFNMMPETSRLSLNITSPGLSSDHAYRSNVLEQPGVSLSANGDSGISVGPCEILTVGLARSS